MKNSAPDRVPIEMLDFRNRCRIALNSDRGLGMPWEHIALRAKVPHSTLYQGVMDPARNLSVEYGARIARAFPEAVNVIAGYFIPEGYAIHRRADRLSGHADLRAWFVQHAEETGNLAAGYREAAADGRITAEERIDLLSHLTAVRDRLDEFESALHGELVCA